jgi:hypothetical protein
VEGRLQISRKERNEFRTTKLPEVEYEINNSYRLSVDS